MTGLLKELKSSHVGFYRNDLQRLSAKAVLGAAYTAIENEASRWVFQNVHAGAPAAKAGIRPGDILIAVNGREYVPPQHPIFAVGSEVEIEVETAAGRVTRTVAIPRIKAKWNQLPKVEPEPIVSQKRIDSETGYMRVASYPGAIGIDVANDITAAIHALDPVHRLIIDLRGNPGGGIGVLRLMSMLTPDRRLVGVSSKGAMIRNAAEVPDNAFVLDSIPSSKLELLPLTLRYLLRGRQRPVAVMTEGLGMRNFHGRVVLLADRNTASANEMLLAFAREHRLAKIVGEPTPGRVLSGSKFKLRYGYTVALPVGAYQSMAGDAIEGAPIPPDFKVPFDPRAAREGKDLQLETAIEVAHGL
jgi:C-terminal processing protease CtpA/Prc